MIKINGQTAGIMVFNNVERHYLGQLIDRVNSSTNAITSSGCDGSFYDYLAFNGISPSDLRNPDNCWSAPQDEQHAWIQYNFPATKTYWFNKIAIKCFSNYDSAWVGDIKVQGSLDGLTWENLLIGGDTVEITAPLQTFATIEIPLNDTVEYSMIRIYGMDAFTVYYAPSLFIDEIYVYGGESYGQKILHNEEYFVETVSKTGTKSVKVIHNRLNGTSSEQIYTESQTSDFVTVCPYFQLKHNSNNTWQVKLLQTIDGYKKDEVIGWSDEADSTFFIVSQYSWSAREEYLWNKYGNDNATVELEGRRYFKTDRHRALVAYYYDGVYTKPVYLSEYPLAVAYSTSIGGGPFPYFATFEYKGRTWYLNGADYAMSGDVSNTISTSLTVKLPQFSNPKEMAKYLLDNCGFEDYTGGGTENGVQKAEGTFVSASTQYGIVDVDCGFKPDLVMVFMPFTGGDTVSYWEKDADWAENNAIWCLVPAEGVAYQVALDRVDGETGIQAINDDGFSFMSNGWNTQGITCRYVAIKY